MRCLYILILLIFIFTNHISAQICAFTDIRDEKLESYTEGYVKKFLSNDIQPRTIARIPVVVHVVWKYDIENISDAQVQSQIDALNRDFRKRNAVSELPPRFRDSAVDVEIEFCLAKQDTNGQATTGITRRKTDTATIGSMYYDTSNRRRIFYTSKQGDDAWNTKKYLNIWVCAFDGGFLGLASSLASAAQRPEEDGIVIDYRAFGTVGTLQAGRQQGRIAVHEMGHYFNLLHIWGSDATCNDDDEVADTPLQADRYSGCPIFPQLSCGTNNMFMNYMDYTNDECMGIFTRGQKARMWAALTGFRSSLLLSSSACNPVATTQIPLPQLMIYPNPAQSMIYIDFKTLDSETMKKIELRDCLGHILFEQTNYSASDIELPIATFPNGIYFLSINTDNQSFLKKIEILR